MLTPGAWTTSSTCMTFPLNVPFAVSGFRRADHRSVARARDVSPFPSFFLDVRNCVLVTPTAAFWLLFSLRGDVDHERRTRSS